MRISKLLIDGFGLFDGQFVLDLPEGTALIIGDNETGKSTLLAAVGAILFGFETESEKAAFAPYGAPSPRCGSLEIEADGRLYRFSRDFASNRAKVELLQPTTRVMFDGSAKPRGRTDEKEAYAELLRNLFGLERLDLFKNSALVEQNSMQPDLKDIVRRIASGSASADYAVALDKLKESCETLTVAVPWGSPKKRKLRKIENLETELQARRGMLSEVHGASAIIEESRNRLVSLDSQVFDITESIARQKAWQNDLTAFSNALEEKVPVQTRLNELRDEMREVEKLAEERNRCETKIRTEYPVYVSLPAQAEPEITMLTRLRENRDELEQMARQVEVEAPRFRLPRFTTAAILAGVLVAAVGIVALHGTMKVSFIIAGIVLCASAFAYAISDIRSRRAAHNAKLSEIRRQLDSSKVPLSEIEERYQELDINDINGVIKELREFKRLLQEKAKKEEALKYHTPLDEIQSKFNSLSNDFLVHTKKLDDLLSTRPALRDAEKSGQLGKALDEARTETGRLEKRLREMTGERDYLKLKLAAAEAKETFSEEKLEEEISEKQSELNRLKLSREAHLLAIKVLDEAISEFRLSHLERIQRKTSEYLSRITGAERNVRLDQELAPLEVQEGELRLDPAQLSHGARDQLFFALRLAAIEEVCGDIRLPILLDDPFVNFDEPRLKATLRMLDVFSESRQIVLFTHDRRYRDWREPFRFLKKSELGS
jgi:uncharacterized protein YhaN